MKQRKQPRLDGRLQINQEIAAADQVQSRKRGVLDQVLPGEHTHFPNAFIDSVAVFDPCEKPADPLFAQTATQLFRAVDP